MTKPLATALGAAAKPPDGATVRARVEIGHPVPRALSAEVESRIRRVVVDTDVNLPGMFEIVFDDEEGWLVDRAGLGIGSAVVIHDGKQDQKLISGEVTAIEARCTDQSILTVLRGYEKSHRLQRATRTRTFVRQSDSQIAVRIAKEHGIDIGMVHPTTHQHPYLAQVVQTDWDFLQGRAREIGYETGVSGGRFYFRRADRSGPAVLGSARPGRATTLTFKKDLLAFLPRMTAAAITPDVELRVWDDWDATVRVGQAPSRTDGTDIAEDTPEDLAKIFTTSSWVKPKRPGGAEPSPTAHVIVDRPVGSGVTASSTARTAAAGVAEHRSGSFAEAEGHVLGNPAVTAGARIEVKGVPRQFEGWWAVSSAQHVFDNDEGGYRTRFVVSGRQDRTLLGLVAPSAAEPPRIRGVVCGVVTNVNDPLRRNRVKVVLPWLSPDYESEWARVALVGAGRHGGVSFLPEVNDEVLVCFEHGDIRRPFVLGGLTNTHTRQALGDDPVRVSGVTGTVVRRGIHTPRGNQLLFEDDVATRTSRISLGGRTGDVVLAIDRDAGTVTLKSVPGTGSGSITIECGQAGRIDVKAGPGGAVTVDGGASLTMKAQASVKIQSDGIVEIKGSQIKLN